MLNKYMRTYVCTHVCILFNLRIPVDWYIIKTKIFTSIVDALHVTVYNMTISSSLTPADLSGFDIIISWTVSDK